MRLWMVLLFFVLAACTRSQQAPPPSTPTPARIAPTPAQIAPTAVPASADSPAPNASPSPDDDDFDTDNDNAPDGPLGPDFEIDASASTYTGYVPKTVAFGAYPLNGTPPVTYAWTFGDGSLAVAGDTAIHTFTKTGRVDVFVTGRDANGATAVVELVLFLMSPEDWGRRHGVEPATLPSETPWGSPTPDVTPLPPDYLPQPYTPAPAPQPPPGSTS